MSRIGAMIENAEKIAKRYFLRNIKFIKYPNTTSIKISNNPPSINISTYKFFTFKILIPKLK